nr:unnamed protein product [Callosobruchus chinensis]
MVSHGVGYLCTHIGVCKIVEIIFCIVVLAVEGGIWNEEVLDGLFSAAVIGLVVSFVLLIVSILMGFGLQCLLGWQSILLLIVGILCVVFGIYTMMEYEELRDTLLIAGTFEFIVGCVYFIDAYLCLKNYCCIV